MSNTQNQPTLQPFNSSVALSFNVDALDTMAVHDNSVVGRLIYHPTETLFDVADKTTADWGFQWVATLDQINHGVLILRPTNRRTKQLVIVGKAMHLIKEYGVTPEVAIRLVQAGWGIRHASHDDVLGLVVETLNSKDWDGYEAQPLAWCKEKMKDTSGGWDRMRSLHRNKIGSAYDMVRHYHEICNEKRQPPPFPEKLLQRALELKS